MNQQQKISSFIVLGMAVLLWFVGPHLSFGGTRPLTSIASRLLVIMMLFGGWLSQAWPLLRVLWRTRQRVWQFINHSYQKGWQWVQVTCKAWRSLGFASHQRRRVRQQLWYLVLGPEKSGKQSLLKNLGLYPTPVGHHGHQQSYRQQYPDFDWWFSEQALFIDVINNDQDNDMVSWKKLLKLLRKLRKRQPINGVLLTFPLTEIINCPHQQRHDFLRHCCRYFRDLHAQFKVQVPVTLIFTQCDRVSGFSEFFNHLSQEEINQVWGIASLINQNSLAATIDHFSQGYSHLVTQLQKYMLWTLSAEQDQQSREKIISFPQQMQLFNQPISVFLSDIFAAVRHPKIMQWQGIYFTSSHQSGETDNLVLKAMVKKYRLQPAACPAVANNSSSYFLHDLLEGVIFSAASHLGYSEKSKRWRRLGYRGVQVALPVLLVLSVLVTYRGYQQNLSHLSQVKRHISQHQTAVASLDSSHLDLVPSLSALMPLQAMQASYTQLQTGSMHSLYVTRLIRQHIDQTMQRALHQLFLPRIAAELENQLQQGIDNQDLLYATLKAYLSFDPDQGGNRKAISELMRYQWDLNYHQEQPQLIGALQQFLQLALAQPLNKLPLDQLLINRTRSSLEQIIPVRRVYGLLELQARSGRYPALPLSHLAGRHFNQVFQIEKTQFIPALYTKVGYEKLFLPHYQALVAEVAKDNHDVGLFQGEVQSTEQINESLQLMYQERYRQRWQSTLADINMVTYDSMDQAIAALEILLDKSSPLLQLLNAIYDNTIGDQFSELNHFAFGQSDSTQLNWLETRQQLTRIHDYLMELSHQVDNDQAAWQSVADTMAGKDNPIQQLVVMAEKAPAPLDRWLHDLAMHCWDVVLHQAYHHINDIWQQQIWPFYQQHLQGRYPLNNQGESSVSVELFNQFFSSSGLWEHYFQQYFQPFINTKATPWQQYDNQGLSLQLSQQTLDLLQRLSTIKQHFFPKDGAQAKVQLSITPWLLDSEAAGVQLQLGPHTLFYQHGPQLARTIQWPWPDDHHDTTMVITEFNQQDINSSLNGPWSLFKWLQQGVWQVGSNPGTYDITDTLSDHRVQWKVHSDLSQAVLQLEDLIGLDLPEQIIGDREPVKEKLNDT